MRSFIRIGVGVAIDGSVLGSLVARRENNVRYRVSCLFGDPLGSCRWTGRCNEAGDDTFIRDRGEKRRPLAPDAYNNAIISGFEIKRGKSRGEARKGGDGIREAESGMILA